MTLMHFHENSIRSKTTIMLFDERIIHYKIPIFNLVAAISHVFSPVMNESLCVRLIKVCTNRGDLLSLLLIHTTCHLTCLHPVLGLRDKPVWMNISRCIFPMLRNSTAPFSFTHTSMPDRMLWDCPSAASCLMAIRCNRTLARKFVLYCYTTSICLWQRGSKQ